MGINDSGARNEVVAFQLILESGNAGAREVDVHLDTLKGPGGVITNRATNGDPFDYVGKHIELFLEQYVNVTFRSYAGGVSTWYGARPLPDEEHLGWIPDALIPFEAVREQPTGSAAPPFCHRTPTQSGSLGGRVHSA